MFSITKIDISNGTGTFTLKKDQTIEIFGLSVGDQYTVSESSYTEDGYTTTWTGQTTGSMTDAGVSLTCTNTYQAEKTTLDGDGTTGALIRMRPIPVWHLPISTTQQQQQFR